MFHTKFAADARGATSIEYALIAVLISVAAIIAFRMLGLNLATIFDTIRAAMA